ncbi:MAG: indolepyruvate oxidoreductase subunit beta [Bacillota bacterium]
MLINLIIAGVGGQGNVLASQIVAGAAVKEGLTAVVGETFGASQRGGSVMSHVRITRGREVGPLIPRGQADLLAALEPLECLRVLRVFGNRETRVIMNERPNYPISVLQGEAAYPSLDDLKAEIGKLARLILSFSATDVAQQAGSPVAANVVLTGALAGTGFLPIALDSYRRTIAELFTGNARELNLRAFELGLERTGRRVAQSPRRLD